MKTSLLALVWLLLIAPGAFAATLTFGTSAPTPAGSAAISNWTGATFDADNVGGSGVNASGGANNGAANDGTTYVATNRPTQGETFTTGSNAVGYTITAITVRMDGYTNNIASGSSIPGYVLSDTTSTFQVRVGQISGTTFIPYTIEYAAAGGAGNPGKGGTANGPGTYLTFTFKAPIVLQPNTVYAFDIGTTGDYFEMLGISTAAAGGTNPYSGGTAYTSGANGVAGGTITTQAGNRVFMVDLAPYTPPAPGTFVHPGLLNTAADYVRMRNNVALGINPWASGYSALTANWMGDNPNWTPNPQATITRSSTLNDTGILYNDIAVAYGCALRWKVSGDTAYADEAVRILNAWGYTLTAINGDTNVTLCNLYGYQFACVAEIMRSYPGWAPADFAQFQTMMNNVFYSEANYFLTTHYGTDYSHYWANWDLCAIEDVYAIGVLDDNPALTNQALTYFYNGLGEGCVDRTVNFIHPGLLGQGQEIGRDEGHASLDVAELACFCQMAWNQGTDLYGYENNRVLSVVEYTAKLNLGNNVPFAPYWSSTGGLMTVPTTGNSTGRPGWATFYNHYVNIMGLAAPYTQTIVNQNGPNWSFNGDEPGWDYLTASLPPIAAGANPSGLTAIVIAQQPVLSWWGSAYATSYNLLRSTTSGGPYTAIATGLTTNTYTDTSVVPGTTYYYVVNGSLASGTTGNSNEASAIIGISLYAELKFDDGTGTTASDSTGDGWTGTLVNGATWATGQTGGAVNLSSASSQYVSLPTGVASDLSDFTISAWVNLSSVSTWARIFDIGYASATSTNERYLFLTASNGSVPRFAITHSGGGGEEGIDSNIPMPLNQWVHVAVTMNGPVATLYINGNAVGQNRNMFTTPNRLPGGIDYAYIGKSGYSADPYLNGKVDDFRIYRGPLSVGQVYTLATGLAPAAAPTVAPTNVTVTALAGNQNSLSWTASPGATNYTVWRATSAGGPYSIVATIVPGTTYVDTGVMAGTTYYYEVDGANSGGDGAVSSASNGVVALPPMPSVPTGVVAFASSSTVNTLDWTAAANAYTYNIQRSLTSGGPYTTLASGVTATTYTDTSLTTGTPYYYVVSSVNTAGVSANSTQVSATPSDLLVHLRFDETYGATAYDSSGNGWNATLVNSPTWTAGIFGNALNFASASTQYGTLATGIVSTVNDFTISVWVNPTSLSTWERVFDFGTGTTDYMFLTVQGSAGAGKPRFGIRTPSVAEQDIDSSVAIPTGTWTQIVITHTGTTGQMYINGTLVGTNSAMTLTPSSLGSTNQNYLGQSQWSADPHLNGTIDDFCLNAHAFTAAQIAADAAPPPTVPTGLSANPSDGLMMLNWAVDATATTYNVMRATVSGGPYTTVGTGLTTPTFVDTGLTDGTTYYYVVNAVNWLGASANSTETVGTPYSIAWAAQDIGTVAAAGSSSVSGPIVTVTGSGADIWGTADAFQFRSVPLTGNCVITARVWSVTDANVWSKAGVMIRGSLAANSMNATLLVTPTTQFGNQWQSRTTNGGSSTATDYPGTTAPYWVRLVRTGTTVQGYQSPDGVNWTLAGTATLSLGTTAYVGLAVTSHDDGTLCTATFDNVSVNWVPNAPGAVTATPGPLQVALSWGSVPNATSYNVYSSSVSGGPYTPLATGLASPSYVQTGFTSGATVYYVVTAENIAGEGVASNEINAAPIYPPAAPGGLTATGGTGQIALSWTASSGATSYNVYRSTTSGGPYGTAIASPTGTTYVDTTAASGTTYYYVVTGVDLAGEGAVSTEVNAAILPGAATGVTASAGNGQVGLNWTAAPGAATYNIGRSSVSGGPYTTIASGGTTTSYIDAGLSNGVTYYYVITGVNAAGVGPTTAEASAEPLPPIAAAPTGVAAVAGNGQVSLSWNAATYATSYNVKRSTTTGGPYTTISSPTGTSAVDTGVTNGTTYYYVVTTVDLAGESGNSTEVNAKPLPPIAAAPTGFAAVASNGQVSLSWNAATYATSYNVKRSTTTGGPYTTISSPTGTSYVDSGVTNGTTYYYVVAAVNIAGTGPNSTQASATPVSPLPGPVTGLTALANSDQVTLTWTVVSNATSYTIARSTVNGGPYTAVASGITAPSYVNTGLTNGTVYYYVAAAVNASGTGPNSTQVSATPTAQNLYWDTAVAAGLANGNGNWDVNTTQIWSNTGAGTSNPLLTYLNDDNAFFQTGGSLTATIASGATIKLGSLTQAVAGTSLTVTGGTLQIDSNAGIVNAAGTTHSIIVNSAVVLNSPNVTVDNEVTVGSVQMLGVISETGGSRALTKIGTGALTLGTVANTFSGGVTLSGTGQVAFSNSASFGTGTITFNAGTSLTSTAQIYTASTTSAGALANNIAVTPGSFGAYTGNHTMMLSGALLNLGAGNGTFLISPGTSAVSVTLSGDNHAYTGTIVYNDNGTTALLLGATNSGSANALWTLTGGKTRGLGASVAGSNTFLLGEVGSASGIGRLFNNQATGTATFQIGDATTKAPSFGGIIADGAAGGQVAVTKTGTDNQVFTGVNTYTGPTAISGGTLTITGSLAAGSTVTVNSGAILAGVGKINGAANLLSGGIVAPGNGGAGTLTFAGGLNLNGGAILNLGLGTSSNSVAMTAGTYTAPSSGTVTINLTALSGFATGKYNLITGATGISASSFAIGAAPSGCSYQLTASGSTLSVTVSAPIAPTGLAATAGNAQVSLTWNTVSVATSYNVKISTTSGGPYTTIANVTTNSLLNTGLTNGTTYYFVVSALNSLGQSANSSQVSAKPLPPIPAAPTGLMVDGFSGANKLSWSVSNGATSYSILRSTSGGSYSTLASGLSGTTYTDSTAVNGKSYSYEVTASNLGGTSVASTASSVTTADPVAYLKFDEGSGTTTADATGDGWTGTLVNTPTWVAGRSVNGVDLNGTNQYITLPTGVVSALTNCTIAMWANLDAATAWSRLFDFGTGTTAYMFLTTNSGATVRFAMTTSGNANEQQINGTTTFPLGGWHHVAVTLAGKIGTLYVDGVQVGQNTAMTLKPSSLGSTTLNYIGKSQFSADPYLNGEIDDFRIYNSALSASQINSLVTTSPLGLQAAPTSLTATAGSTQVALTWTAPAGATSYDVLRATVSGGPYTTVATGVTAANFTDTGLTTGTTYYYAIMALSATSESPNSNQASATAQ